MKLGEYMEDDDSGYLKDKAERDAVEDNRLRVNALYALLEHHRTTANAAMDLVYAQGRMLEKWAESSDEKKSELWKDLHAKGDALRETLTPTNRS